MTCILVVGFPSASKWMAPKAERQAPPTARDGLQSGNPGLRKPTFKIPRNKLKNATLTDRRRVS
jgi:hypothetical protein